MSKEKIERVKNEGEMKSSANIIIYFNGDVININEGVTFICKRPAYFFYSIYNVICGITRWILLMHKFKHSEDNGENNIQVSNLYFLRVHSTSSYSNKR